MRIPNSQDMAKLSRLTSVREKLAMAELSEALRRMESVEQRLRSLKAKSYDDPSTTNAAVLQKWLTWRDQKILCYQSDLARATAEYLEVARRCGRFIAEAKVVEKLSEESKNAEKERYTKRQTEEIQSHIS